MVERAETDNGRKNRETRMEQERRALEFCKGYADVLKIDTRAASRRALVIGGGASSRVETELCLMKALELAGCRPIVLIAVRGQ